MASLNVPSDIWIYISQFIPTKALRNLYSVNRVFLHLALNERYKEISFLQVNQKTLKVLEHLRDPNISSRVRRVRVNPLWFNLPPAPTKSKCSLRSIILRYSPFDLGRSADTSIRDNRFHRQRINILTTEIVLSFTNVTSFAIVTRYFPHPEAFHPFLSNAWHTFGSNLQRLTINGPLRGFDAFLPSPGDLKSLEDLTLRFSTDLLSDESADVEWLFEIVSPFLRELSSRLRKLNIMSSALGDHSSLFHALHDTSNLVSLSLDIGFYPQLLLDPSGLTHLLRRNVGILKHVKFQPHQTFRSLPIPGHAHDHFSRWMNANLSDELLLSDLETFVVAPLADLTIPLSMGFDATSPYITRSKDTLTNLILGEHCLSFDELALLASTFAHRPAHSGLKTLYVKALSLNPQLFDLLANQLIGLNDLDIKFNRLIADVKDESSIPFEDQEPTEQMIDEFLGEMAKRVYENWMLYSLWIWQRSHMTTKTAHDILTALKPSIPSVRIVYRMDHIHPLNGIFL
ncbi:hypothetical protein Hypma_000554 [Hypsizygus marmoreus]|uniref:F-box domain-containing protein n=1 Tax=Hypsizygus marmoreus TaxID=39966 RepID=A0A369JHI7_HYPMA|nr:hypothetical protein Hypma_000554 [Hypsizygus marmoreus]